MTLSQNVEESTPLLKTTVTVVTTVHSIQVSRPSIVTQLLIALVACHGSLTLGFVEGYSSPVLQELQAKELLTNDDQVSWFASLATLGAIIGGLAACVTVEILGRKGSIIAGAIPFTIGSFLLIMASGPSGYILLYIGRFLTGVAMGMYNSSVPLYLAEVSSKHVRGTITVLHEILTSVGTLVMYSVGIFIPWNWLAFLALTVTVVLVIIMCVMPESPRWLIKKGCSKSAMDAIVRLRGRNYDSQSEFDEMESNLLEHKHSTLSMVELTRPAVYRSLLTVTGLRILQQLTGIQLIVFYSADILAEAGFPSVTCMACILVALVKVLGTIVTMVFIDKTGRKPLYYFSGTLMMFSLLAFGCYYYFTTHMASYIDLSWLSLLSFITFVFGYAAGWGPLNSVVGPEILPIKIRGVANGLAIVVNWTSAFLVTKYSPSLTLLISPYGTYWMFSVICLLGTMYVAVFVPETKGRSLEEIEHFFDKRRMDPQQSIPRSNYSILSGSTTYSEVSDTV